MRLCTESFQEGPVSGRAAFGLACVTIGEKTQSTSQEQWFEMLHC